MNFGLAYTASQSQDKAHSLAYLSSEGLTSVLIHKDKGLQTEAGVVGREHYCGGAINWHQLRDVIVTSEWASAIT